MNRPFSSLSLRAANLIKLNQRRKFMQPLGTQRKGLRLEQLETRAVFDCNEIHVVFAPDTPLATVQAYEDLAHQDGIDAFSFGDTDRWSRTVTNGTGLVQGDATVIRWSVVPDGTPISGYNGEPAAPSNLRSWLAGIYGSNTTSTRAQDQPWFDEMQSVFDRWSAVSGVTYVYEPADDGAALGSQYAGSVNVRGDVRISGHYIDGPSNILAYNFYPTVGDMVLDTGDTFFNNTGSNSIRLRNTMAHEAGHGLGLGHVTPTNGTKLMEPSISLGFDGPQADDILAVNRGYGDRLEKNGGNNTTATATALTGSTFTIDTISIDDDSDVDWFRFTVGAGSSLSVTVTPTGSTYTSNGTTFNSLAQSNLAFAIYSGNGTTVLTTVNSTAAGLAETLSNYNLSAAGTYYVRVSGSANAAQMYRLSGTISNVTTTAPEIAVLDGQTNIADGAGSVSLASVDVGGVSSKTFTIQNLGNANLTLDSVSLPAGFELTQAPLSSTVAPGASTSFIVSLNTVVAGTFSGTVSFTTNDPDENPFNFTLAGTVTTPSLLAPEIEILDGTTNLVDGQSMVNFGSATVGGTLVKTFTIRNTGTANLSLTNIVLPTAYSLTAGPAVTSIAPGGSTTITLSLNTASAGTFSGGVALGNNDANEGPFNFNVTGTVTATPTTPTTLFSDNFNRASSSYLGSNWSERAGNFNVSNQGLQSSSSGTSLATVNNISAADVILTADVNLGTGTAGRDAGLVARHSGSGVGSQYWAGIAYNGGRYYAQIWEANNGSWTRLSQTQISSGTASLKFEVVGTSLKLYVNGTLSVSATDSTLTNGRIGLSAIGSGMRLDNFVTQRPAASLVAPATVPASGSVATPGGSNRTPTATPTAMNAAAQQLAALDQLLALWGLHNYPR